MRRRLAAEGVVVGGYTMLRSGRSWRLKSRGSRHTARVPCRASRWSSGLESTRKALDPGPATPPRSGLARPECDTLDARAAVSRLKLDQPFGTPTHGPAGAVTLGTLGAVSLASDALAVLAVGPLRSRSARTGTFGVARPSGPVPWLGPAPRAGTAGDPSPHCPDAPDRSSTARRPEPRGDGSGRGASAPRSGTTDTGAS